MKGGKKKTTLYSLLALCPQNPPRDSREWLGHGGPKIKIDIWFGILSDNKELCLWSPWCYFMPQSPIYWFDDPYSSSQKLLPARPQVYSRLIRGGPDQATLRGSLVLLPWLISV